MQNQKQTGQSPQSHVTVRQKSLPGKCSLFVGFGSEGPTWFQRTKLTKILMVFPLLALLVLQLASPHSITSAAQDRPRQLSNAPPSALHVHYLPTADLKAGRKLRQTGCWGSFCPLGLKPSGGSSGNPAARNRGGDHLCT
jgi:hypothetical protein